MLRLAKPLKRFTAWHSFTRLHPGADPGSRTPSELRGHVGFRFLILKEGNGAAEVQGNGEKRFRLGEQRCSDCRKRPRNMSMTRTAVDLQFSLSFDPSLGCEAVRAHRNLDSNDSVWTVIRTTSRNLVVPSRFNDAALQLNHLKYGRHTTGAITGGPN